MMDEIEFRTGRPPNLHLERHAAAMRTVRHPGTPRDLSFEACRHADGRVSYPGIVQYRLPDGTILDLPPAPATHPDTEPPPKHAVMMRKDGAPRSIRFDLVIHDNDAYEQLARSGLLYSAEHKGARSTITDNRKSPGV